MTTRSTMAAVCALLMLCGCEGASQVDKNAKDFDNADRDALQKQQQDMQQQADQQRQQKELLERLQQDCQNVNFLQQPEGPIRASDAGILPAGAVMLVADMQLAWGGGSGGGGGKGGRANNCP